MNIFLWVLFILQRQVQSADPTPFLKYIWKHIPSGEEGFSKYVVNLPQRQNRQRHRDKDRGWKTSTTMLTPSVTIICVSVYFEALRFG